MNIFKDFCMNIQLLSENAKMPTRATSGDAGLDFFTPEDFEIPANGSYLVDLELRCEFSKGFALVFEPRSGIASKQNVIRGAKIVDSGYRGNLKVDLKNLTDETVKFKQGDKIIQGVVYPIWYGQPNLVEEISTGTERGDGGFGSSGN